MSIDDRDHWDKRYTEREAVSTDRSTERSEDGPADCPAAFVGLVDHFPTSGAALDLACGRGMGSVWLAKRGLDVTGLDVSPVAIEAAESAAEAHGVSSRCHFEVADLDDGLPRESHFDLVMCHMFRGRALDDAIIEVLEPGGLLAIATLSEVGSNGGRFHQEAGALERDFAELELIAATEGNGRAVLLARKR